MKNMKQWYLKDQFVLSKVITKLRSFIMFYLLNIATAAL